jgi:hypothetical protein
MKTLTERRIATKRLVRAPGCQPQRAEHQYLGLVAIFGFAVFIAA